MSRKTTGASRRVVVGTALLGVTALVGSTFAVANTDTPTITGVFDALAATDTAAVGPLAGGGSAVRLVGTDLDKLTTVYFGGQPSTKFIVESPTLAYATPPVVEDATDVATYKVDVKPNAPATTSNGTPADDYLYTAGPVVSSVRTVDKSVEITGTQLLGATAVLFGDTLVKVDKKATPSDVKVTVKAPSLKGGAYSVSVINPLGIGSKAAAWGAAPVISKVVLANEFGTKSAKAVTRASAATGTVMTTPAAASAATGTVLIASGTGFTGLTSLTFGTASASFVVLNDTTVRVRVPAMATETADKSGVTYAVQIKAANGNGPSAKGVKFQYDALPTVSAITPAVGTATSSTNTVTITGAFLGGKGAKVKVGTANAKVAATSTNESLTLTVGRGSAGTPVDVVVTTSAGVVTAPKAYSWK